MGRWAPEPMPTNSVRSPKWSLTVWSLLAQACCAFAITAAKFRKSEYSSTRAKSRADQNSAPAGLTRLIRSKVLGAAGGEFCSDMQELYSNLTLRKRKKNAILRGGQPASASP